MRWSELRQRRLVIFIDNYSIHPFQRKQIFQSIERSLDTLLRPGDEAMVKIEQPFDVRVKNHPDYRVRSRRTYEARTMDEQQSDRVIANIYRESKGELAVAVQTGAPKKSGLNRWSIRSSSPRTST